MCPKPQEPGSGTEKGRSLCECKEVLRSGFSQRLTGCPTHNGSGWPLMVLCDPASKPSEVRSIKELK